MTNVKYFAMLGLVAMVNLTACAPKPVSGTLWTCNMAGENSPPYLHADTIYTFSGGTADAEMRCDNAAGEDGKPADRMLTLDVIVKTPDDKPLKLASESAERGQITLIDHYGHQKTRWVEIRSPGHFSISFLGSGSDASIELPAMIQLHLVDGHNQRLSVDTDQPGYRRFLERCETYVVSDITVVPR